jgi:hypothetical protein
MIDVSLSSQRSHLCNGVSRRDFLRVGSLAVGGLSLADLLRARAAAAESGQAPNDTAVKKDCLKEQVLLAEKNNLSELEEELDKNLFYRANRKYIINANFVKRFKPLDRSKLSVELQLPINEEIIISQENSSSFKKWISEM